MSRILVVDDDIISAGLVCHALHKAGYHVRIAIDGWHACHILEKDTFDAIVTDEIMSVMNGQELCRAVRDQGLKMPIIMVTCMDAELDHVKLRDELGVVAVLGKPFNPRLLLGILKTYLEPADHWHEIQQAAKSILLIHPQAVRHNAGAAV